MFESFVTAGKKPLIAVAESKVESIPAKMKDRWKLLTELNEAPQDTFKNKGLSTLKGESLTLWSRIKAFFHIRKISKGKGSKVEEDLAGKMGDLVKQHETAIARNRINPADVEKELGIGAGSRLETLKNIPEWEGNHQLLDDIRLAMSNLRLRAGVNGNTTGPVRKAMNNALLEAFPDGVPENIRPDELKTGVRTVFDKMNEYWKGKGEDLEEIPSFLN